MVPDREHLHRWGRHAHAVAQWEHITGRTAPTPTFVSDDGGPRPSPRFVEWLMGLACVAAFIAAVLAPNWMGPARLPWLLLGGAFYYLGIGYFLWHASRSRRTDQLAAVVLRARGG